MNRYFTSIYYPDYSDIDPDGMVMVRERFSIDWDAVKVDAKAAASWIGRKIGQYVKSLSDVPTFNCAVC